jgi:hypothetical protein
MSARPSTHTLLVHGAQVAVIATFSPTSYAVTCYVGTVPTVAYDATTYAEAERWAKLVIEYPKSAGETHP